MQAGPEGSYKSARDAKEVETPQVAGTVPLRLLLCRAKVDRLAKQLGVPHVDGRVPVTVLPCKEKPWRDCKQARQVA